MKTLLLAFVSATLVMAQEPPQKRLEYEVASIKPHADTDFRIMIQTGVGNGGRLNLSGVPVSVLIQLAYGGDLTPMPLFGQSSSLTGLPGWAQNARFDIDARPEAGFRPTKDQMQEMLRSLLEDRFALKIHKETKDGPVYDLVVAKDGPKIKLSADQTPVVPGAPPPGGAPPPPPPPRGPNFPALSTPLGDLPPGMRMNGPGMMRGTAQTTASLARMLSPSAGRQVIDKTGLAGLYDFEVKFAPSQPAQMPPGMTPPPGAPLPEPDLNAPSIFTAVQEQLGLKLESSKAPLESIVIDHLEKPSAN